MARNKCEHIVLIVFDVEWCLGFVELIKRHFQEPFLRICAVCASK